MPQLFFGLGPSGKSGMPKLCFIIVLNGITFGSNALQLGEQVLETKAQCVRDKMHS